MVLLLPIGLWLVCILLAFMTYDLGGCGVWFRLVLWWCFVLAALGFVSGLLMGLVCC